MRGENACSLAAREQSKPMELGGKKTQSGRTGATSSPARHRTHLTGTRVTTPLQGPSAGQRGAFLPHAHTPQ